MAFTWILLSLLWSITNGAEINQLHCQPPDLPVWGGYGPQQSYYIPGDVIHYYCEVDTHIGGNYYRRCQDNGDWTGDTPVCDAPSAFSSTTQSSDADEDSTSESAVDGVRTTCSETMGGQGEEWSGNFTQAGELIRVMLFLPKGPVSYEIVLLKENGEEVICGSVTTNIDRYDWIIQNCPGPQNIGASGLKIKSLTTEPVKICEIAAHVLTSPKCADPHFYIVNGHLRLSRKSATLICNKEYIRSPTTRLECIRDGVWTRQNLYCEKRPWEVDDREVAGNDEDVPGTKPNQENSETEN